MLGTGPALTMFGEDYPTPDGTPIRDYIHVVDLAEAHVRAIATLLDGADSAIMNVGTGSGATVKQVIEAAERVMGAPVPRTVGPRRAGDPPALVADVGLIRQRLGWTARYSDMDRIIRDAARWQRERSW